MGISNAAVIVLCIVGAGGQSASISSSNPEHLEYDHNVPLHMLSATL